MWMQPNSDWITSGCPCSSDCERSTHMSFTRTNNSYLCQCDCSLSTCWGEAVSASDSVWYTSSVAALGDDAVCSDADPEHATINCCWWCCMAFDAAAAGCQHKECSSSSSSSSSNIIIIINIKQNVIIFVIFGPGTDLICYDHHFPQNFEPSCGICPFFADGISWKIIYWPVIWGQLQHILVGFMRP